MNYLGACLLFLGLVGIATGLLCITAGLLGLVKGCALLIVSIGAGWFGAELVDRHS